MHSIQNYETTVKQYIVSGECSIWTHSDPMDAHRLFDMGIFRDKAINQIANDPSVASAPNIHLEADAATLTPH